MKSQFKYRRVYPFLFRHPGFRKLSRVGQVLTLYLICGPQSNRIGLFYLSLHAAADDLGVTVKSLRGAVREVLGSFGWMFDGTANVFYIPSWWRWNPPDHRHVLQGNLRDLREIPPCGLVEAFVGNLAHLPPELHETFVEACRGAHAKAPRGQEHVQKQIQVQPRSRRVATNGPLASGRSAAMEEPVLRRIALETIRESSGDVGLEYLVDDFLERCRNEGQTMTRSIAIVALTEARGQVTSLSGSQ